MLQAACVKGYVYRFRPQNPGIYILVKTKSPFLTKSVSLLLYQLKQASAVSLKSCMNLISGTFLPSKGAKS
jgi:hypothetical protein